MPTSPDGPVGAAAPLIEHRRPAILLRLGRLGWIAAPAHRLPGRAGELVLASDLPAAANGMRVAAGLALGDPLEVPASCRAARCGRARGARAGGRRARRSGGRGRGKPERPPGLRTDDPVDLEAVTPLEPLDDRLRSPAVDAGRGNAQGSLHRAHGRPAGTPG